MILDVLAPVASRSDRVRSRMSLLLGLCLAGPGCTPPANDLGEDPVLPDGDGGTTAAPADPGGTTNAEPGPGASETGPAAEDSTDDGSTDTEDTIDTDTDTDGDPFADSAFACVLDEPCGTTYFGCTDHTGCDDATPPVWGPNALCVLQLLRDMSSMPAGAAFELNFDRGGSPDWITTENTYLLYSDGTSIHQTFQLDDKFDNETLFSAQQCTLEAPAYFQACLDNPSWDCGATGTWVVDCLPVADVTCPEP